MNGQNRELVDELVSLSLKYGLMTPYTSFLADENVPLHARVEHERRAADSLRALNEESGQAGVAQRDAKQNLMQAARAPAAGANAAQQGPVIVGTQGGGLSNFSPQLDSAAAKSGQQGQGQAGRGGAMGGGMAGMGRMMGRGAQAKSTPAGANQFAWSERKEQVGAQAKVRQIGTKTFYFKNGRWVDSSVKPDEDAKAEKVVQFTEGYFRLARSQKAEYNQYFSQQEPVTVKLEGKVYHIDPEPQQQAR